MLAECTFARRNQHCKPSATGRTSWSLHTAFYGGETGIGVGFAHRFNTSFALAITGSYGNGGGQEHIRRVGLMGEF